MKGQALDNKVTDFNELGWIISLDDFENNKEFVASDFAKSNDRTVQRNLSKWESQGILFNTEFDENKKRKFSFVEAVWIKIVQELRAIGYSKENILEARESLSMRNSFRVLITRIINVLPIITEENLKVDSLEPRDLEKENEDIDFHDETSYLGSAIAHCIENRVPVIMLFFKNGGVSIIDLEDITDSSTLVELFDSTFTVVSLNSILQDMMIDDKLNFIFPKLHALTKAEWEVLQELKNENVEELSVKFSSKKEILIESTVKLNPDPEKRLSEILTKGGYENIEYKTQDGRIVKALKTTKRKVSRVPDKPDQ